MENLILDARAGGEAMLEVSIAVSPVMHIGAINLIFTMPKNFSATDHVKLEKAAEMCPIKKVFILIFRFLKQLEIT
jgi:hypothetical protein